MDAKRSQLLRRGGPPGPSPGDPPGGRVPLGDALDHLSRDIQQLRIDFERFFAGDLHVPPEDLRTRIQTRIRGLRSNSGLSAVESFRLGDLEARLNSYSELFNRRLRDREEGRLRQASRATPPPESHFDPTAGIVVSRQPDEAAVTALFQGLVSAPGGQSVDLETFKTYLSRQAAAIREKTGCEEVQFRVTTEDGKVKLKARPLSSARTA